MRSIPPCTCPSRQTSKGNSWVSGDCQGGGSAGRGTVQPSGRGTGRGRLSTPGVRQRGEEKGDWGSVGNPRRLHGGREISPGGQQPLTQRQCNEHKVSTPRRGELRGSAYNSVWPENGVGGTQRRLGPACEELHSRSVSALEPGLSGGEAAPSLQQ